MQTKFHTLSPMDTIAEAVRHFQIAIEDERKKVKSCHGEAELSDAIQQMLLRDVQRIFVHGSDPTEIVGVLSLSDAARFRSGSCRACTSSRLMQTE